MTKNDRCENELPAHDASTGSEINSGSDVGSIPVSGGEPEFGDDATEDLVPHISPARISVSLNQKLETGVEVDVIIEVTDSEALKFVSNAVMMLIGSEAAVQTFEDGLPAPYVVASLDAVQVEEIAQIDGVMSIEENVIVSADSLDRIESMPPIEPSIGLVDERRSGKHSKGHENEQP